jgi:GNAT superfamily N-acetyltransferase
MHLAETLWPRPPRLSHAAGGRLRFRRLYLEDPVDRLRFHLAQPVGARGGSLRESMYRLDPSGNPRLKGGCHLALVAEEGGQPIGRFLVSCQPGAREAWFCCADLPPKAEAADGLLGRAVRWCRERNVGALRGPFGLGLDDPAGLPTEIPAGGTGAHIGTCLQAAGLQPCEERLGWQIRLEGEGDILDRLLARSERSLDQLGVRVRNAGLRHLHAEMVGWEEILSALHDGRWGDEGPGPCPANERLHELARFALPGSVQVAEVDDKPAGFSLTLPESMTLRRGGSLARAWEGTCLQWGHYRAEHLRVRLIAVHPAWEESGLAEALLAKALDNCRLSGARAVDVGPTPASAHGICRTMRELGAPLVGRAQIFQCRFDSV